MDGWMELNGWNGLNEWMDGWMDGIEWNSNGI